MGSVTQGACGEYMEQAGPRGCLGAEREEQPRPWMGEGQPEYWAHPGERGVPDPQGDRVMFQRLSKIKNDRYSWI